MINLFEYSTLTEPDNIQQFKQIMTQCFNTPAQRNEFYFNRIGIENFRIIREAKQVVGGLALMPMGQWWQGQRLAMTGIASLGVAPEHRGMKVASTLLQQTLRELYTTGIPLSVLYPVTQPLYRQVGYEQSGLFCSWEIPTQSIARQAQPLPLLPIKPLQHQNLPLLYQQQARQFNGHLDRHPLIWQRFFQPKEREFIYAYTIGAAEQPEGYVIVGQQQTQGSSTLRVKDWAVHSAEAAQSLWAFLANHAPQARTLYWRGSITDPLTVLLPEPTAKLKRMLRWMLRIVDVRSALMQRGYPLGIQGELHLEIQDNLLLANNGKWILTVANRHGEMQPGGRGDLKLNVRSLAPLYTGFLSPYQLQTAGQLEATEAALLTATQFFTGSLPWMPDFF